MIFLRQTASNLIDKLPPNVAARMDEMRLSLRSPWGGPLNGQVQRRAIARDIARQLDFDSVIETGTFRGTSTEFFWSVFGVPVRTVEGSERFHAYSRRRLEPFTGVHCYLGDSRSFLAAQGADVTAGTTFFYLDAHWQNDLPLAEELRIIASRWSRAVIMIDDFKVPDDPGFTYDDYGAGKALTEDYLPAGEMPGWGLYYPQLPSHSETGAKRGSCVIVSPELVENAGFSTLRFSRTF